MDKVSFYDIAGYEDEKRQAFKIVNWLKNYETYKKEGAYLPKGLLLCGSPGVGKTMLAKAIATESNAYFVDVKLSGVIDLKDTIQQFSLAFKEAKEHIPSILFLDEIDQLIGNRMVSDSDERHRMVDFLLQELDGSTSSEGVIVIATCNNRASLPSALLRSGRMDQHIEFETPNEENRKAVLKLYLSKSKKLSKINVDDIVKQTNGFHCADLKSLCNTVLIECIDNKKEFAENEDFDRILNTIRIKDIDRKTKKKNFSPNIAYHELGHFAVFYHLFHKICPTRIDIKYGGAGYMINTRSENETFESKINTIDVLLAGKVSEEMFTGSKSIGCRSDIGSAVGNIDSLIDIGCYGYEYLEITTYADEPQRTSNDLLKKREELQAKLLLERENNVKEILSKEKGLIEYLYPVLMKKGKIGYRSMIYYTNKYEREYRPKEN